MNKQAMDKNGNPDAKTDLRVRRTRKLLWDALIGLLEHRTFESLSIQEICDTAMVHRTTFYKHFEDKYHLASYGLSLIDELFANTSCEQRLLHPFKTFQRFADTKQFRALTKAAKENHFLSNLMIKHGAESLNRDLTEARQHGFSSDIPLEIFAPFYSGAVCSICSWWIENGMKQSPEEMDEYIRRMFNHEVFSPDWG
ncbi:TetR/AcrR family transcriptional regulator [Cohnella soli]|uniref:TetR/AcrR family transcriptional regulator C-terminal domain-containing protein n=1 Tax=Cohnella soli TaxID=425005 RepID=A0ABW0HQJ3_9BACL